MTIKAKSLACDLDWVDDWLHRRGRPYHRADKHTPNQQSINDHNAYNHPYAHRCEYRDGSNCSSRFYGDYAHGTRHPLPIPQ